MNTVGIKRSLMVGVVGGLWSLAPAWAAPGKGPLKVFILAGQSNMDGKAAIRTIDYLGEDKDPARAALLKIFKPAGQNYVTRDDVWVSNWDYNGNLVAGLGGRQDYTKPGGNIGPEYAFGYYMGEALDQQVLLIKHGPGGKSLRIDYRPPSAGMPAGMKRADGRDPSAPTEGGAQYQALVGYVRDTLYNLKTEYPGYDAKAGYEIAGLVWFQGFNDLGISKEEYANTLVCLIKDLRKEFKAPDMKVVVGVMGVNGAKNEGGKQVGVRQGQRFINTVAEFNGNARAIETAPLLDEKVVELTAGGWLGQRDFKTNPMTPDEKALLQRATSSQGYHYNGEGRFFILLGKAFAEAMLELMGPLKP